MGGNRVVMVSTGRFYTVAVVQDGALWVWGDGGHGQLYLGDINNRLVPTRVVVEAFGGSWVLMAACGKLEVSVPVCSLVGWVLFGLFDMRMCVSV